MALQTVQMREGVKRPPESSDALHPLHRNDGEFSDEDTRPGPQSTANNSYGMNTVGKEQRNPRPGSRPQYQRLRLLSGFDIE